jgi:hypothetical protein
MSLAMKPVWNAMILEALTSSYHFVSTKHAIGLRIKKLLVETVISVVLYSDPDWSV